MDRREHARAWRSACRDRLLAGAHLRARRALPLSSSPARARWRRRTGCSERRLGFTAMLARARLLQERVLPHGWLDALRQISLFAAVYFAYKLVRGLAEGDANAAFAHARDVITLE